MRLRHIVPGMVCLMGGGLSASDLSVQDLAGFLKAISANAGSPGRIACRDVDMAMALKRSGISTDVRSIAAWAVDASQTRAYASEGKFIICPSPALLREGASLAILREQGHPVLILHAGHAKASGVQLSDSLMKIARVLPGS